ncbi:MAG: TRAP transporter substrate-binding protein [Gammaproteobacteria bacterium]|nr:TRAP transporter substrate-binding protein [Gammaproteobacteria bacterium]
MKRRELIKGLAAGSVVGLAACKGNRTAAGPAAPAAAARREWKMYTTWPKNFPGLGTGANRVAELITKMSGGRLTVTVYGAGERVPALEVFDAVAQGSAQMGHSGSYYWKGKAESSPFFCSIPFGLTAEEMNGWLYFGGGLELWRELYAGFNLVPFPAGNSGTQMGGWFRKEINSLADLRGLKMRIPGLGGEVLARLGVTTVNIPGGELFTALSSGTIDATEWVGPYNDLAFGLYKAAKFYYYPGWHEPGSTLECIVNKPAYEALEPDLQAIVAAACDAVTTTMQAEMTARNQAALQELVGKHGVKLLPFPAEVLQALMKTSEEVVAASAGKDTFTQRVYASYKAYRDTVIENSRIGTQAFLNARSAR